MAIGLPRFRYSDGISKKQQVQFGGYDCRDTMTDGILCDALNLTSELFPTLSVRSPRMQDPQTLHNPSGMIGGDSLCYVSDTNVWYGNEIIGDIVAGEKTFAAMGDFIIILPDKKYYNIYSQEFGSLEETYQGTARQISFADGIYAEVFAEGCAVE